MPLRTCYLKPLSLELVSTPHQRVPSHVAAAGLPLHCICWLPRAAQVPPASQQGRPQAVRALLCLPTAVSTHSWCAKPCPLAFSMMQEGKISHIHSAHRTTWLFPLFSSIFQLWHRPCLKQRGSLRMSMLRVEKLWVVLCWSVAPFFPYYG